GVPVEGWGEALVAFDVPKRKVAAFAPQPSGGVVLEFTHLVLASPYGMMTDGKAVVIDHEQLIPILARLGVSTSFEERRDDYGIRFSLGGRETRFVPPLASGDHQFFPPAFPF